MDLDRIESLLEKYFEGITTLEQEKELKSYFLGDNVAPHLTAYSSLFTAFNQAKKETSKVAFNTEVLQQKPRKEQKKWFGIAATIAVLAVLAGFMFSNKQAAQEDKEAIAAYKQAKEALKTLSQKFNQGAETLVAINQFTTAKNKVLK
jgi:hypothetical protein